MIAASFFTPNGKYPELGRRLSVSLDRFGLINKILPISDQGSWQKGNAAKPQFIWDMLIEFRRPILWIDVDCELLKLPHLLWGGTHDFACYNWRADPENANDLPVEPENMLSSGGVFYFGYTAPALELLQRWIDGMKAKPGAADDQVLDGVFKSHRPPVRPLWLPRKYNWMPRFGRPPVDCVIRHDCAGGKHAV